MNHIEYKIYDEVYCDIVLGKKNIEFRLLNDKSNSIEIGDEIKFNAIDNKYIIVEVINKYIYDNIDDLRNHKEVLNNALNYNKEEFINVFNNIFGKEKVVNSKIDGIEFKIKEVK